jgi:hypothetical protein
MRNDRDQFIFMWSCAFSAPPTFSSLQLGSYGGKPEFIAGKLY